MEFNELVGKLLEERATIVTELRGMYDAAELRSEDERGLTGEEQASEARMATAISELDTRIARANSMAASQRAADQAGLDSQLPPAGETSSTVEERSERQRFDAMLRGEERSFELRDDVNLNITTATDGPELVPTTLYSQLWEHVVDTSPILQTGVTILNTAGGGDLVLPKTTSYSAAALVAEAAAIGRDAPQLSTVTLGAYKIGFLVQVTSELLQDSQFNVVDFVLRQGGAALGRGADTYFVTGSGSAEPAGIDLATAATQTFSVGTPTMDSLIDIMHEVIPAARAGAVWMFNDAIVNLIRKLKGSDLNYIWQPSVQAGEPDRLLGYPVYVDPNFGSTATTVGGIFGNPRGFYVRQSGGFRVERSDEYAFNTDLSTFRFLTRIDSDTLDETAFRAIDLVA